MLKTAIKRFLNYKPIDESREIRTLIDNNNRTKRPSVGCPDYQGDLLYKLIDSAKCKNALEIGFASGSTALYMLAALRKHNGKLVSIDYKQSDFGYAGVDLIRIANLSDSHILIEENSNVVLPKLLQERAKFDFAFLDGWKTFDHVMLDLYYVNQMLNVGGVVVFDDTRMPSVNKAVSFLISHYQYKELDYSQWGENAKLKAWFVLTSWTIRRPYRAFRKIISTSDLPVQKDYNFYRSF